MDQLDSSYLNGLVRFIETRGFDGSCYPLMDYERLENDIEFIKNTIRNEFHRLKFHCLPIIGTSSKILKDYDTDDSEVDQDDISCGGFYEYYVRSDISEITTASSFVMAISCCREHDKSRYHNRKLLCELPINDKKVYVFMTLKFLKDCDTCSGANSYVIDIRFSDKLCDLLAFCLTPSEIEVVYREIGHSWFTGSSIVIHTL